MVTQVQNANATITQVAVGLKKPIKQIILHVGVPK